MKKINILIFSSLISIQSFSQQNPTLLPFKENYKWGYINQEGKTIIEAKYEKTTDFSCDIAKVKKDGKFGVIDKSGTEILNPIYSELKIVCPGFVIFKKDSLYGLASNKGEILLENNYHDIELAGNTLFIIKNKQATGIFNAGNKQKIEPEFASLDIKEPFIIVNKNQKKGLYAISLQELYPAQETEIEVIDTTAIMVKAKDFWAVGDGKGQLLTKAEYMAYKKFGNDLIMLKAKAGGWVLYNKSNKKLIYSDPQDSYTPLDKELIVTNKNHKHGLIDKTGTALLPPFYTNIHLNDNLLLIEQNGKWGLADRKGKVIIETVHTKLFPFKKNIAVFETETGKGIIDNKGKILLAPKFKEIDIINHNTAVCTKQEGGTTTIKLDQLSGKPKTPAPVTKAPSENGHVWIKGPNKKWGLIGHDTVFVPFKFDEILSGNNEFSLVGMKVDYRTSPRIFGFINSQRMADHIMHKVGLVNKINGKTILQPTVWYIRYEDFEKGEYGKVILEGGQQGLVSKTTGKIIQEVTITTKDKKILKEQINYVGKFSEGIASFCTGCNVNLAGDFNSEKAEGGKWGFIAQDGKILTEPQFESVSEIINKRSIVKVKGFYGVISVSGAYILKPEFSSIKYLNGSDNKYFITEQKKEKYGVINQEGKVIADLNYDRIYPYKEGFARIMTGGKYGFINEKGEIIVTPKFDNAYDFSGGLAAVAVGKLWGYLNAKGETEILPLTPFAGNFKNGLAPVSKDGKIGYMNTDSKIIVAPIYRAATDFNNGLAIVTLMNGVKNIIDTTGKELLPEPAEDIKFLNNPNFLKIRMENGHKLYSKNAAKIITKKTVPDIYDYAEGLIMFKNDKYFNFMDTTGKAILTKKYTSAGNFSDGFARVQLDNKWSYINKKGQVQLGPFNNGVTDFVNNRAFIEGPKKYWALIDKNGKNLTYDIFISPKNFVNGFALTGIPAREYYFTDTAGNNAFNRKFEMAYSFEGTVARVKKQKWGLIDTDGNLLVDYKYDTMEEFMAGQSVVSKQSQLGLYDLNGKAIAEPQFDEITYVSTGLFKVEKSDALGYLKQDNNWFIPLKK